MKEGRDAIPGTSVLPLLDELFPRAARSGVSDWAPGMTMVCFQEFLKLARRVQDSEDLNALEREQGLLQASGFSRLEVQEFREVFNMYDSDGSKTLSSKELARMLRGMTSAQAAETQVYLAALNEDGQRELEFGDFLVMMAKMLRPHTQA